MEFRLILKKIHDRLTPEEAREFQQWYDASKDHRDYFHQVKEHYHFENFTPARPDQAWKKVDKRLFSKTRNRYRWASLAAAAVALVFIIPYLFHYDRGATRAPLTDSPSIEMPDNGVVFIDEEGAHKVLQGEEGITGTYYRASENNLQVSANMADQTGLAGEGEVRFNTLIVPRGKTYSVDLVDGTKIWINADTKLSFPSSFEQMEERLVHIAYGEAYFDVASSMHNDGKNFIVRSDKQEIEVLGTKFNLSAYPENDVTATTLLEGAVKVRTSGTAVDLQPGQQSLVHSSTPDIQVQEIDVFEEIAWIDGKYIFHQQSLEEIMRVVERWYDVEVEFKGVTARHEAYSGILRKSQDLKVILEILESTNKAIFELNGSSLEIRDKKEGNGA